MCHVIDRAKPVMHMTSVLLKRLCLALLAGLSAAELKLSSPSFSDGGEYPIDSRGKGDNISPKLAWTGETHTPHITTHTRPSPTALLRPPRCAEEHRVVRAHR